MIHVANFGDRLRLMNNNNTEKIQLLQKYCQLYAILHDFLNCDKTNILLRLLENSYCYISKTRNG
jgi:hypothetical protein